MEENLIAEVTWGPVSRTSDYVYASMIQQKGTKILFDNRYFASGKTIKTWLSKTNFQANRMAPPLPLLAPGREYSVRKHFTSEPEGTVYLQFHYYNRQNELIDTEILKDTDERFTLPKDTFWYQLSIVGAGCHAVIFEKIAIYGQIDQRELFLEEGLNLQYKRKDLPSELFLVKDFIQTVTDEGV
ncbi:TPA: accessory Sec system protein Asp3 [Streptococcus suis]